MPRYFSHDSNARNSKKIARLRMKHGAAGYGVYFMLLERLREEEDYFCALDYDILAFDIREDKELIRSVIEDFGLFEITADGKSFHSIGFDERMELVKVRSEAGKKGADKRWNNPKNDDTMAQDGKTIANGWQTDSNKIKINKREINKRNYSFQEEEKEEEVSLKAIIFFKNWAKPCEEYRKFVAFNSTGGRHWDQMSFDEKRAALELWKQKPAQPPRMKPEYLKFWKKVFDILQALEAPTDILLAALDDRIAIETIKPSQLIIISCSVLLRDFIERYLDAFAKTYREFRESCGFQTDKFIYRLPQCLPSQTAKQS